MPARDGGGRTAQATPPFLGSDGDPESIETLRRRPARTGAQTTKTGWGLIDCFRAVNDPIAPDRVVNEIIGKVLSVSRQGDSHVIRYEGPASVQDFESTRMVSDVILEVSPALSASDVVLIASSLGRQLAAFGLIMADSTDDKVYRAPQLIRITVS